MAIFEKTIRNKNFDKLLRKLENEIPDSSWSADLEAGSDFKEGDARCSVRVFERYSMMGGNRLSLTLTMFQNGDSPIRLSAITAGGSQAVFFKVNKTVELVLPVRSARVLMGMGPSSPSTVRTRAWGKVSCSRPKWTRNSRDMCWETRR